jgi:hypothetical protein
MEPFLIGHFVSNGLLNNGAGLRHMFTKRQLSRAFRDAGICDIAPGELLYVLSQMVEGHHVPDFLLHKVGLRQLVGNRFN